MMYSLFIGEQTEPTVKHLSALCLQWAAGANNATVSFTGSNGITYPTEDSFTLNQAGDVTIDIAGPDLSSYLQEPSTDGSFIIK